MNKVTLLLAKHADGSDQFKSSVARALLLSMSGTEIEDVTDVGTTDPFATDKNIQRVLGLGFISKSDLEDPVLLAGALAAALVATVDMVSETDEVRASTLNEAQVLKFQKQYTEKFSNMAFLQERYDDELLFNGVEKNEAAGMARALIAVSGQHLDLWTRVAQEGTV